MNDKEKLITDMCYTWRHDYGLDKPIGTKFADTVSSGMTEQERQLLRSSMANLIEKCIEPFYQQSASPQPLARQPLTDEEILKVLSPDLWGHIEGPWREMRLRDARAIERAHGIGVGISK